MKHRHFKFNKPFGYLSQFISNTGKKDKLLGEFYDFPEGIMSIGRLDKTSEGLLLLTTDGKVSFAINKGGVEKEYYAQVDGEITDKAIRQMTEGLDLKHQSGTYRSLPCKVRRLEQEPTLPKRGRKIRDNRHGPTSWISVSITEGKFRQVRKMTAQVGFPTLRLVRVRVGDIYLNEMQPGDVIEVDALI